MSVLSGCETPSDGTEPEPTSPRSDPPSETARPRTETTDAPDRTRQPEFQFEETVNVVESFGCDPSGNQPCDGALREAAADGRRLVFPSGTYQFSGRVPLKGYDLLGIQGEGNVRFVPPAGFNDLLLNVESSKFFLENVVVDIRKSDRLAGIRTVTDTRLHIENLKHLGRGAHGDGSGVHGLLPVVQNPDGHGIIRNYVATKGSSWGNYGSGRAGIYIGRMNQGTIEIVDAHLEEFGGAGIYATATPGDVRVYGGMFRNNNVASIRIGGKGSLVADATIEANLSKYSGPRKYEEQAFRLRGIVLNQKSAYIDKAPGVRVQGCTIRIGGNVPKPGPGITVHGPAKTATIRDTDIRIDADGIPAIYRSRRAPFGKHPPSGEPRWVLLDGVRISGDAQGAAAIELEEAPNSILRGIDIEQPGRERNGVRLVQSHGCELDDVSVRSQGFPLVVVVPRPDDVPSELVSFARTANLRQVGGQGDLPEAVTAFDASSANGSDTGTQTFYGYESDGGITLPSSAEGSLRFLITGVEDSHVTGYVTGMPENPWR